VSLYELIVLLYRTIAKQTLVAIFLHCTIRDQGNSPTYMHMNRHF